jgi:hypothetical protein
MHRSVCLRAEAELDPVKSAGGIYQIACTILRWERLMDRPRRLLVLGVTGLVLPSTQMVLPL